MFLTLAVVLMTIRPRLDWRGIVMALATLILGMALFLLFFGLVAYCDRL